MSTGCWWAKPDYSLCAVVGVVSLVKVIFNLKARVYATPGKRVQQVSAPSTPWLDHQSFHVLSTIIDTFAPSLSMNEVSDERIRAMMESFDLLDSVPNAPITLATLIKHRSFLCAGALDYNTHHHVFKAMDKNLSPSEKDKIKGLLDLLATSAGSFILTGYPVPFQDLPLQIRERVLLQWRDHSLEQIRSIFQLFKRSVSVMYMSALNDNNPSASDNPIWKDIGYDPDAARVGVEFSTEDFENDKILRAQINSDYVLKQLQAQINPETGNTEVSIDAVVIGSGCGGGVVAHNLIHAGYNVLLLDKEGYYNKAEFARWREIDALDKTFDKAGLMSTEDANFAIFAGSCVGGGSVINWSASFATPHHVLEDWYQQTGIPHFDPSNTQSAYAVAMREVHKLFQINTDNSFRAHDHDESCSSSTCSDQSTFVMNENNRILWQLAEKNGYIPERISRNVKDCVDCGHCCYGCSHDRKMSTPHLIYEPILLHQYKTNHPLTTASRQVGQLYVLPFCHVDRVLTTVNPSTQKKRAVGVLATLTPSSAEKRLAQPPIRLVVHAKVSVVCAGAIHTPAILLRSQFQHDGIGRGLSLHPVVPVSSLMTKDVDTGLSRGVSMGVVVRNPPIFDPKTGSRRFPVAIETPPAHTAITSTVMPWQGSLAFKMMMLAYRHSAVFIGISRDKSHRNNRVCIDANGDPVVHYRISSEDGDLVLQALEVMLRFFASDSRTTAMMFGHSSFPPFVRHVHETSDQERRRLDAYIADMRREGMQPLRMQMYSAHQMATVRMARSVDEGPVNPRGELFECENCFIADGAVLPSSLGINPMLTIEAFAYMISQHVIQTLRL
jgi:long-chain-alcohol oxidase